MKKKLSLLISLVYCAVSQNLLLKAATAQVTPDGTTNTSVDINGDNFTIEQAPKKSPRRLRSQF